MLFSNNYVHFLMVILSLYLHIYLRIYEMNIILI